MNSQEIFGAEIQYFRLDPRYWERIILQLKDTGLRCVTTYVQWSTHLVGPPDKRHPAGVLDFEGKTNPRLNLLRFLALVEKHGLNLNFRCGPFCCNEMIHGGYPSWLVLGDPAIMVWDYQNIDSDYNPVNVRPGGFYHQFLTRKYGAVRCLPYPQKFRAMEDVTPPRAVPDEVCSSS